MADEGLGIAAGMEITYHPNPPGIPYPLLVLHFRLESGETKSVSLLARNAPEKEMLAALQKLDAAFAGVLAAKQNG